MTTTTAEAALQFDPSWITAALRESGVTQAPVTAVRAQECATHYRQSALFAIGPGMALLGQMQLSGDDGRGLADRFIVRACLHAHHLGAFETLR